MEMSMKHYYCSEGEPRPLTHGMTQESAFSSMSSSHSCMATSPEITNSFLALLSGPPLLFQDSHGLPNMKLLNASNSLAFGSTGISSRTTPNLAQFQDTGNKNLRSGMDMHPVLSSRYATTANADVGRLSHDELDAVTEVITHADSGTKDTGNAIFLKEGYLGSWTVAQDEILIGSNSWVQRTSEVASSVPNKPSSVKTGLRRVFCIGTCGDLVLSNTGHLGVVCSCHGLPMSISKFCEHSGLSNVNPGDAVRMDSGETIAHWRKLYLLKLGIRVPEDHKEWDWPEEFSLNAAGAKCDMRVTERTKKFDLPDLVGSSYESMKSGNLLNDVFVRNSHPSAKYVGEMSGNRQLGGGYDSCNSLFMGLTESSGNPSFVGDNHILLCSSPNCLTLTKSTGKGPDNCSQMDNPGRTLVSKSGDDWHSSVFMGMSGCSKSSLCAVADKHTLVCPSPSYLTVTKAVGRGPQNDSFLNSPGSNSVSKCGISSVSAFQNLGNLGSEARNNLREGFVLNRGVVSSSTELMLGQPSQQSWTLGSKVLSATGLQTSYPQKISPEQLIHNLGNSRAMENHRQLFQCNAGSSDSSTKEDKCQVDLMSHVIEVSAGSDAYHVEHSKDDLCKSSMISLLVPWQNPSSKGNVNCKEGSKVVSDTHCFILWALHSQSQIKSQPVSFPYNRNDGPVGSLDTSRSAFQKQVERTVQAGYWHNNASLVTAKSFRFFAEEMQESGTFTRNIGDCHLRDSDAAHAKKSDPFQFSSMLLDTCNSSNPSNYSAKFSGVGSSGLRTLSSTSGINTSLPSQTFSTGFSSSNLNAFLNNDVVGVSPHILDERLRNLASRNVVKSYKQQNKHTSSVLNQQRTIHSSLCGSRMESSILNPLASSVQKSGPYYSASASEVALKSLLCNAGCAIGQMVKASGANSWEHLKICPESVALHSKDNSLCQCFPDPLPNELSLPRTKGHIASLNVHVNCCQGGQSTYVSGRSSCADHTKSLKRNCDCKGVGSVIGLKQPLSIVDGEASMLSALRIHDSVAVEGTISVDCNREVKGSICEKLDSQCSQCKDAPSNVKHKIKCINEPADELEKKRETEVLFDDSVIEETHRSDQAAKSSKVQELSTVSSECSAPAVTQALIEVNNVVSFTVDASEPRNANDQVVDQVSPIDNCYSSDDAIESGRSEYLCSSGKFNSVKEEPLKQHWNAVSHVNMKEVKGNMNQVRDNDLDGPDSSEYPINSKHGSRLKSVQRRHKTKWRMLGTSLIASKASLLCSPLCSSDDANLQCRTFKDYELLLQSEQAPSQVCRAHSKGHSSKRKRSFLSCFKSFPRKRSIDSIYNIDKDESNNQKRLKGDSEFAELPQVGAPEMLKWDKCSDAIKQFRKHGITKEALKCSALDCIKRDTHSQPSYQNRKAKPIVCGMYGIISSGEDKIKPPKIIPLHQVLKTTRTGGEFRNDEHEMALVTELKKISFSGSNCCIDGFPISRKGELSKFDKVGYAGKRNVRTSSPAQSRPICKEIRKRSLSELCMEGERHIHPELNFSKTSESALPENCWAGMEKLESAGETEDHSANLPRVMNQRSVGKVWHRSLVSDFDASCCVCGGSNKDNTNSLVECRQCLIRVHQACYGIPRVPKSYWYCRPCKTSSNDIACVLCGYGGGAMTRAVGSQGIVKSLLKAWNIRPESGVKCMVASSEVLHGNQPCTSTKSMVRNSITAGLLDSNVKQWVHVVCGLWTPGTWCPDVNTMSAFDVSGACPKVNVVCSVCKRPGGSCIQCRVETCSIWFHPWCAHQKGFSQCEVEGAKNDKVGFYVSCKFHFASQPCELESHLVNFVTEGEKEAACARTEGFKGRKQDGVRLNTSSGSKGNSGCLVPHEQFNAWLHINRQKLNVKGLLKLSFSDVEHDFRKEYARYKQSKLWKYLVVYNSGIHALGLYTSQFIPRGAMVVEYVGEIVGPRVADKREREYQSGRKLQYKSACYFFRIDKEHIIDATCKGGIARFVNHSCQPNCVAKITSIRNEKKVVFFAERDIYPGEEITYDYHFNHEDEGKKIPCFCNAKNCRRYLN